MKTTETKSKPQTKTTTKKSGGVAEGLRELFEDELKDIYWAEKALLKAIPKMIKNASSEELIAALEDHLSVTEQQVTRVEAVFDVLNLKPEGKKCEAMAGLIKEAEEIMKECKKGMVRDAGIISAAQKIEHYEIATYGTLRTFALTLEEDDAADFLQMTLDEEKDADSALTDIAEAFINAEAV
ncbi:MAG: ferritin-like domain-containing protein [Bacteroidia bacterium]